MILEAFGQQLQQPHHRGRSPEAVLCQWLASILLVPPSQNAGRKAADPTALTPEEEVAVQQEQVARVIHAELELCEHEESFFFQPRSESGRILLESLFSYCRSFDNWQFSRWLHHIQASDFSPV